MVQEVRMKRSEMLSKIYLACTSTYPTLDVEHILLAIEEAGMLPPQYTPKGGVSKGFLPKFGGGEYPPVNEWEDEETSPKGA